MLNTVWWEIPEPPLEPPEEKPVLWCSECGCGIYRGESYLDLRQDPVCESCEKDCKRTAE